MQRLSYQTETVLSNHITRNRIVLSFKDSPRNPLGQRPLAVVWLLAGRVHRFNGRCSAAWPGLVWASILSSSSLSGLGLVKMVDFKCHCQKLRFSEHILLPLNRFLVGLNGAGVLYYFFRSKDGIACVATKYFTQWHLVSLNCMRDKS